MPVVRGVSQAEMEAMAPCSKGLVLKVCRPSGEGEQVVTQSNAILRMIAVMKPEALLYGRTEFDSAQASLFIFGCHTRLCVRLRFSSCDTLIRCARLIPCLVDTNKSLSFYTKPKMKSTNGKRTTPFTPEMHYNQLSIAGQVICRRIRHHA